MGIAEIREKANTELSKAVPENPRADAAQTSRLDGICFTETQYSLEHEAIMKKLLDKTTEQITNIHEKANAELSKAVPENPRADAARQSQKIQSWLERRRARRASETLKGQTF